MKEKNPCTYVVEVLWAYLPLIYVCIDAAAELKKQWKGYENVAFFRDAVGTLLVQVFRQQKN